MKKKKEESTENVTEVVETKEKKTKKSKEEKVESVEEKKSEEVFDVFGSSAKESSGDDEAKKKKREELLERAKKLGSEKVTAEVKTDELKEKLAKKDKDNMLVPIEDYVKCGIHIGTKVITPHIRPYVYRRRADGIAVINTNSIDDKLREAIEFLKKFEAKDFVVVCKREAGWRAVDLFSQLTGVRVFTKKYPAGIITNSSLPNFFETEMVFVCDPWLDKNAMSDARKTKKKVMAICDTNNYAFNVDVVIPGNNKSNKSLGMFFYILAREYIKAKGIDKQLPSLETFVGEKLE